MIESAKKEIVSSLQTNAVCGDYLSKHNEVWEQVQQDISCWSEDLHKQLILKNPFREEECFIERISSKLAGEVLQNIDSLANEYEKFSSDNKGVFDFYKNKSFVCESQSDKEALVQDLLSVLRNRLQVRKQLWLIPKIQKSKEKCIQMLLDKLKHFEELMTVMGPSKSAQKLGAKNGQGYESLDTNEKQDLAKKYWKILPNKNETVIESSDSGFGDEFTEFHNTGFDVLKNCVTFLKNNPSLQDFANILGRCDCNHEEQEFKMKEKTVSYTEYHPLRAYKGQVCGVSQGNDISSVLPSELALMRNPVTKKLFELKFAQKQLLSFKYVNMSPQTITQTEKEFVPKHTEEEKGPIIICVDTSYSMHGTPEKIAKLLAFALTKIAIEENRKCFFISFSMSIETLNLAEISNGRGPIENLVSFLQHSFLGGTDVEPALKKSLQLLKEKDWNLADVLLISDFEMRNLSKPMLKSIQIEQKKGTRFYSLEFGECGNSQVLKAIGLNWEYINGEVRKVTNKKRYE